MAHKNSLFGKSEKLIYMLQFKWNLQPSDEDTSEVI